MNIYIVRIFLLNPDNPLTVENLKVFSDFDLAKKYVSDFCDTNKFKLKGNVDDNIFNENSRYYMYEDFIEEQFIWVEKHEL